MGKREKDMFMLAEDLFVGSKRINNHVVCNLWCIIALQHLPMQMLLILCVLLLECGHLELQRKRKKKHLANCHIFTETYSILHSCHFIHILLLSIILFVI